MPRSVDGCQTDYYDVPFGEMLFGGKDEDKEDTGSLMDTSINNAVIEYGFPAEFFLDTLCRCDTAGFFTLLTYR